MNYLFVVAHCDDELLGCGATLLDLIDTGNNVSVVCMTMEAPTREDPIANIMKSIHQKIGVKKTFIYPAKALELETYPRLDCVEFIENAILDTRADCVFTHYKHDLHPDHRRVYELVMEAIRLPQRSPSKEINNIQQLLSFEVPCSTAWSDVSFNADCFFEISQCNLYRKINLVRAYDNVLRNSPHPRSVSNIIALAKYRGSQCGCLYAESFINLFNLRLL